MKIQKDSNTGKEQTVIVRLSGHVDMSSSPELRKALMECTDNKVKNLLLDFSLVEYMDSSGLATLVEAFQNLARYGGTLKLYNLKAAVRDLIHLAKMDQIFKVFVTEQDALK